LAGELGYDQQLRQPSDIETDLVQFRPLWEQCGSRSRHLRGSGNP